MRISFHHPPPEIIGDYDRWWHPSTVTFTTFTDEFSEWVALSNIVVSVTGHGQHLQAYWNAANDEDAPRVIHFDFSREQDALAFKMRWL